jgi:hypothetical protein
MRPAVTSAYAPMSSTMPIQPATSMSTVVIS